jgi:hypothetical protein
MKSLRYFLFGLIAAAGFAASTFAADAATRAAPAALQVRVEVPFVFNPLYDDDIADTLFWHVKRSLGVQEKSLAVEQIRNDDKVDAARPLLTITLLHWRATRMGDIECRFTAEYRTADGTKSLGLFEGTTSALMRSRAFVGRDYERAAEDAGRQLGQALRERQLI